MFGSAIYWLSRKFAYIDFKFSEIDKRFEEFRKEVDRRFEEVNKNIARLGEGLRSGVLAIHTLLIEFLGLKGSIEEREVKYLISQAHKVMSMISLTNPLSREDIEFLKQVFSKEPKDITMEEAEKIIEIGKKWWKEDGTEEAYRIFLTGLYIKAYLISKSVKKKQNN